MKRRLKEMKDMAGKTFAPLRQIYDGNLDASTSSAVSPFSNISSTLSKRRKIVLPKVPETVNESKEIFVLCCGCGKKEISYLLRPCGNMVSEICFRRRCCKCCGVFIVDYVKLPQLQLYYVTFVLFSLFSYQEHQRNFIKELKS